MYLCPGWAAMWCAIFSADALAGRRRAPRQAIALQLSLVLAVYRTQAAGHITGTALSTTPCTTLVNRDDYSLWQKG